MGRGNNCHCIKCSLSRDEEFKHNQNEQTDPPTDDNETSITPKTRQFKRFTEEENKLLMEQFTNHFLHEQEGKKKKLRQRN